MEHHNELDPAATAALNEQQVTPAAPGTASANPQESLTPDESMDEIEAASDAALRFEDKLSFLEELITFMRAHVGDPEWENGQGQSMAKLAQKQVDALPNALRDAGAAIARAPALESISKMKGGFDRVFDRAATPEFAHSIARVAGSANKSGLADAERHVWAEQVLQSRNSVYNYPTAMPGADWKDPQQWKGKPAPPSPN